MTTPTPEFQNLRLEVEEGLALLVIDRPRVLNALNQATMDELKQAFEGPLAESSVQVVILTGSGEKAFVAGADIRELQGMDPLAARASSRFGQEVLASIERFSKPVIAAINGYCLGGGLELALACHLRIAAAGARLGLPEVKLGLIPGYGGTQRLTRLVGKGKALEMILSGAGVEAQEALRAGLVNRVVEPARLLEESRKLARAIQANGPVAVRYAIEAVNNGVGMPPREGERLESTFFGLTFATDDMREGTLAFLEKRPPRFQGK